MVLSFLDIIGIITTFQLLLLTIVLINYKKGNRTSNLILSGFMFANALFIANFIIFRVRIISIYDYPYLYFWGSSLYFLFAPLLYLYTKSLCFQNFTFTKKHLTHFLPYFVFSLFYTVRYFIRLTPIGAEPTSGFRIISPVDSFIHYAGLNIQILCYVIAIMITLYFYRSKLKQMFSSIENINLSWLLLIIFAFILMWLMDVLIWIFSLTDLGTSDTIYFLTLSSLVINFIFATVVVYNGLKQPEIFSGIAEKLKYAQSKLTREKSEQHIKKLLQFMKTRKPYLEPSLTLNELANNLSIPSRYLSQEINNSLKQNFFDFINSYRIEEAKLLFADPANNKKTVLEILYEVGFNSKSVFNNAFKKHTGTTPTQFKRLQQN